MTTRISKREKGERAVRALEVLGYRWLDEEARSAQPTAAASSRSRSDKRDYDEDEEDE